MDPGRTRRVAAVVLLAAVAGCSSASPRPSASHGSTSHSPAAAPDPAPATPTTDGVQEMLRHLSGPKDVPDRAGVSRIGPGHYFWETADGRMCFVSSGGFPDFSTTCGGPSAAERDHQPELSALFGPGAYAADDIYLVFRVGHGTLDSLTLAGRPVRARWVRHLGAGVGGGDAYYLALPGWPHHEQLKARISTGGRQRTHTIDVDL